MNKDLVLSKCNYFVDVQLWPIKDSLDPEAWLSNFLPDELEHAVNLLNSFQYFSETLVNQMFIAGFQMFSNQIRKQKDSYLEAKTAWHNFIDNALITPLRGEIPSIADSGFIFARKARQQLGLKERQLLNKEECLELLQKSTGPFSIIFVDDFLGSGRQLIHTWEKEIKLGPDWVSFKSLSSSLRNTKFYYFPIIATTYGMGRVLKQYPEIAILPVHELSSKYSALAPDSIIWPEHLKASAHDFLLNASTRAGIMNWKGFHDLSLCLGFYHSVPDATLPIFFSDKNGWKPLIKRT